MVLELGLDLEDRLPRAQCRSEAFEDLVADLSGFAMVGNLDRVLDRATSRQFGRTVDPSGSPGGRQSVPNRHGDFLPTNESHPVRS